MAGTMAVAAVIKPSLGATPTHPVRWAWDNRKEGASITSVSPASAAGLTSHQTPRAEEVREAWPFTTATPESVQLAPPIPQVSPTWTTPTLTRSSRGRPMEGSASPTSPTTGGEPSSCQTPGKSTSQGMCTSTQEGPVVEVGATL